MPPRLPHVHNIGYKIHLILGTIPMTITPYGLSFLEEDEIVIQHKYYLG